MIVYCVFAILLIAMNLFLYYFKVSKKGNMIANAVLLILFSSLRSVNIGTDTIAYSGLYDYFGEQSLNAPIPSHLEDFFGYRIICKIVYIISDGNYQIMLFVCSVIIIYGLFKYIYYYSDNSTASVFYYITLFYFFFSWNAVRQSMAMSIILLSIIAFDEKKYLKCILLSVFAVSVHNAVVVLFICFVIKKIKWNKGIFAVYVSVLIIGMVMVENLILLFFKLFPRYASVYINTLTTGSISVFGGEAKGRKIILSFIFLFFILYSLLVLKKDKFAPLERTDLEISLKCESLWFFSALTMIEIVIGVIYSKNTMYLRVQSFVSFFSIFLLPAVIERTNKKYKNIIYIATNIVFMLTTIIRMLGGESNIYPYEFCF